MSSSRTSPSRLLGILIIVIGVILANVYWASFVAQEKTLYTADHVAYWSLTSGLADGLKKAPLWALREVSRSVAEDELNLLPSLPLAPISAVAGKSRTAWILTVFNMYAIPALLMGWWAFRRVRETCDDRAGFETDGWAWLVAVGLFAPLWIPVSLGYLGIGGLILAFAAYGLWLGPPARGTKELLWRAFLVGALLAVLVMFRRWYAFWSLAFCILVACEAAGDLIGARSRGWKKMAGAIAGPLVMAAALLTTLLALGGPRLGAMVATNYADRYVHYKIHATLVGEGVEVIRQFGFVPLLVALVGFCALVRWEGGRRIAFFVGGQTVLAAVLFRRVQDPSPQHWYLLLPGLLILGAWGISFASGAFRSRKKTVLAAATAVAFWLSFGVLGVAPPVPAPVGPEVRVVPAIRADIDEIHRLLRFLDDRLAVEDRWIYLLSATGAISDTGLGFANRSLGTSYRSPGRFLMAAQVDRRDGFPIGLFDAGLIIVPEPTQVRGTTQRVVELPTMSFREGLDIARAFVQLPGEFRLDNNVTLRVWERIRANTPEEIDALSRRLREYYPDRPYVWQVPVLDAASTE